MGQAVIFPQLSKNLALTSPKVVPARRKLVIQKSGGWCETDFQIEMSEAR